VASQPPHITLVPPVNVSRDSFPAALRLVRTVAEQFGPVLELTLGPAEAFAGAVEPGERRAEPGQAGVPVPSQDPRSVLYLAVGGTGVDHLRTMSKLLRVGPLHRPDVHEYTPHLTIHEYLPTDQAEAALVALRDCRLQLRVTDLVVLERPSGSRWGQVMTTPLGSPSIRGRGGVELRYRVTRTAGPEALALGLSARPDLLDPPSVWSDDERFVEVEHDGIVVGAAYLSRRQPWTVEGPGTTATEPAWTVKEVVVDPSVAWASLEDRLNAEARTVADGLQANGLEANG
jgi:2'-5' RNA ligase superfamily